MHGTARARVMPASQRCEQLVHWHGCTGRPRPTRSDSPAETTARSPSTLSTHHDDRPMQGVTPGMRRSTRAPPYAHAQANTLPANAGANALPADATVMAKPLTAPRRRAGTVLLVSRNMQVNADTDAPFLTQANTMMAMKRCTADTCPHTTPRVTCAARDVTAQHAAEARTSADAGPACRWWHSPRLGRAPSQGRSRPLHQ